jgi:toxin YoeB
MANKKTTNKAAAKQSTISWTDHAWEDYVAWQKDDLEVVQKINTLLDDCLRSPFAGLGKPEPLKGDLTGFWSRRITKEHRLVYLYEDGCVYVVQARYHY